MPEKLFYQKPAQIGGAYTGLLASQLDNKIDYSPLILGPESSDFENLKRIIVSLVRNNVESCSTALSKNQKARVVIAPLSYSLKNILSTQDSIAYQKALSTSVKIAREVIDEELIKHPHLDVQTVTSIGFHPGWIGNPDETESEIAQTLRPQFEAAKEENLLGIVEATATSLRLKTALKIAGQCGLSKIALGCMMNPDGTLAGDGSSILNIFNVIQRIQDSASVEVALGFNCGSAQGALRAIQEARKQFPNYSPEFVYTNLADVSLKELLEAEEQNSWHLLKNQHVSPNGVFQLLLESQPAIVGLCCGYNNTITFDDNRQLGELLSAHSWPEGESRQLFQSFHY